MKIFSHKGTYQFQDTDGPIITIPIQFGKNDSQEFISAEAILDSGCTGLVLSESLAKALGIEQQDIEGESVVETANGDVSEPVVTLNILIKCLPSGETVQLQGIQTTISKSEVTLLGTSVLQYFDVLLKSGELVLLELNPQVVS